MSDRTPIDSADALQSGCSIAIIRPFLRLLAYASALTIGGLIASTSEGIAGFVKHPHWLSRIGNPFELAGYGLECAAETAVSWFPVTISGFAIFLWIEDHLPWWWFSFVCIQTICALLLNCITRNQLAWLPALLLCGTVGTAVWFAQAWWLSRWARELAIIRAEAASDIAAQESAQRDVTDESA